MPHTNVFYQWKDRVQAIFPMLRPHHQNALAEFSFGMALSGKCGLTFVAFCLAEFLAVPIHALTRRLREFYLPADAQRGPARSVFDFTLCFRPLLRWAASGHPHKRLVIALDPTVLKDRLRVLCVSVLYHGTALPVAWRVQKSSEKGSWNTIWRDLLRQIQDELDNDWTILVLTDRGLESPDLFRFITSLGWHPLMRVKAAGHFQPAGWYKGHAMHKFASAPGRRWSGTGTAYPGGTALECTLMACHEEGHAEPWLILTDLGPHAACPAWYAWRMRIEQGFRTLKRGQFDWHRTRTEEPDRVARQWAVLAVTTIWLIEIGGAASPATLPRIPKPPERPRRICLLKRGLIRLRAMLSNLKPLPVGGLLPEDPSIPPPRASDHLTEDMMNES